MMRSGRGFWMIMRMIDLHPNEAGSGLEHFIDLFGYVCFSISAVFRFFFIEAGCLAMRVVVEGLKKL